MTTYGALARTNVTIVNAYALGSGVVAPNTRTVVLKRQRIMVLTIDITK